MSSLPPKVTVTPAPLIRVLRWLFLEPAQVPQLLTESPWRGLRMLAGSLLLAGVIVGAARAPGVWNEALEWTQWFGKEVGTVQLSADGKLKWENPATVPYTTRHAGWRVEFMPAGSTFPEKPSEGAELRGIWISPEEVILWARPTGNERAFGQEIFKDGKIFGMLDPQQFGIPVGKPLDGDALVLLVRNLLPPGIAGGIVLGTIVFGGMQICLYLVMFSIIPVMLRSPWAARGFMGILSFYSFMAVPALMAAAVYSAFDLPGLDFGTVFIFGFFVYMLLMFWQVQRASAPPNLKDDDDDV